VLEHKALSIILSSIPFIFWLAEVAKMHNPSRSNQELQEENTVLRQKIQELQESEASYKMLFANATEGLLIAELQTKKFIHANAALCKMIGYSEEELLQLNLQDIHPQDSLKHVLVEFDALTRGEKTCAQEIPCLRKDGTLFHADICVSLIVFDGKKCNAGFFTDITERNRSAEVLHERDERLQSILNHAEEIIHMIAWDGTFLYISPSWEHYTGFPVSDTIGKNFVQYIHPDDAPGCLEVVKNVYETGNPHKILEFRVKHVSGKWIWFMNSGVSIKDSQGKPRYFMGVAMDITDRKRAEAELKESERRYRELSIIDNLTQLYNHRHFYEQLHMELNRVDRYQQPLTLLLLDLDNFKAFNDTYGHVKGDQVLFRLGQVVKRCLRQTDSAYRYGGEEFTILLPMTTSSTGVVTAERIRTEFKKENFSPVSGKCVHMTVSIGIDQYKPDEDMKAFVHQVDQPMYQAKKNGKDRVCSES
jgi:diguanylate cyclase (GGDEF)-like protein/PAS domain S-box-containing protein